MTESGWLARAIRAAGERQADTRPVITPPLSSKKEEHMTSSDPFRVLCPRCQTLQLEDPSHPGHLASHHCTDAHADALDIVARQVLAQAARHSIWSLLSDLSPSDRLSVVDRLQALAPHPSYEEFEAAYAFLQDRA